MRSGIRWFLFAIGVLMGASLLAQADVIGWLSAEPTQWQVAKAENLWLEGERSEAIAHLRKSLEGKQGNLPNLSLLASWGLRNDDFEVVHWACDQAESQINFASQPMLAYAFAQQRSFAFFRQREAEKALNCWAPFVDVEPLASTPQFLNGYAYIRSLVGLELDEAAVQSDRALESFGWTDVDIHHRLGLAHEDAGRPQEALVEYDKAQQALEPQLKRFQSEFERSVGTIVLEESLKDPQVKNELRALREKRDNIQQRWAMLLAHRVSALELLGQSDEAKELGTEVERLGFDLESLQDLRFTDADLLGFAAQLDTRGWIRFRSGEFEQAVEDLTQAVQCGEAGFELQKELYRETMKKIVHSEAIEDEWSQQRQSLAVMYDHLAQALYEVGRTDEAADMEKKVTDMGFEAGPHLY